MKTTYRLYKRGDVYCVQNNETGQQRSLRTKDEREATKLLNAKNDAAQTPTLNRALGRVFLSATDPEAATRPWKAVMERFAATGKESTRQRRERETAYRVYNPIRNKPLVETTADDYYRVLNAGGAATNHTLRLLQNLACGMGWLPAPIIPVKLWPKVVKRARRGITAEEHEKIIAGENNTERRQFYQMLWEIGAAQTDTANLTAECVDWKTKTLTFYRQKTGSMAKLAIGPNLESLLLKLPKSGPLFPAITKTTVNDRSAEFCRRRKLAGVSGVSLHSYRYGWAERAAQAGYPERFAQFALGQNSRAVHQAYAKKAIVQCPALDEYERKVIPMPTAQGAGEQKAGGERKLAG